MDSVIAFRTSIHGWHPVATDNSYAYYSICCIYWSILL